MLPGLMSRRRFDALNRVPLVHMQGFIFLVISCFQQSGAKIVLDLEATKKPFWPVRPNTHMSVATGGGNLITSAG